MMARERSEVDDKSSEEAHELFERSTSRLFEPKAGRSPAPRFSRRLFIVHALHGLMLCINFCILVVSFRHWEHRVGVRLENIGNVNSYIAVSFQTFFTASILTLYLLSSASAVDMAIRHPTTLTDLDFRLQAWTGLGSSLSNIFFQLGKFKTIHKSITIGIPLYFISGEVLKITSSSVVGVATYYDSSTTTMSSAASNHLEAFTYQSLQHTDFADQIACEYTLPGTPYGLWQAARINMFLADINDTTRPGLQGRVLHDIPKAGIDSYELVHVNSTKIEVQCAQVTDASVEINLRPFHSYSSYRPGWDVISATPWPIANTTGRVIRANDAGFTIDTTDANDDNGFSDIWLNVSMSLPPYWLSGPSTNWYYVDASNLTFSNYWQAFTDTKNDTAVFLQPWGPQDNALPSTALKGFPTKKAGVSNQLIFALVTRNATNLIRDASNSFGHVYNSTAIYGGCAMQCKDNRNLTNAACIASLSDQDLSRCTRTLHTQVIGCTMHTSQSTVSLTQEGLLSSADTDTAINTSSAHYWGSSFEWENPSESDDFLAKEFLHMFVPTICNSGPKANPNYLVQDSTYMQTVLRSFVNRTAELGTLEDALERMASSYLWNVRQSCNSPFQYGSAYTQCNATRVQAQALSMNGASFTWSRTLARLQIVQWKAVVTMICSVMLFGLAVWLLGAKTDLERETQLQGARFVDVALMMKDSSIPDVTSTGGTERVHISYRENGNQPQLDVKTIYGDSEWL